MTSEPVFKYDDYRAYLSVISTAKGKRGGVKSELAAAMNSHPAYLSRVLNGQANLSLEQAERIAKYLGLKRDEKRYFFFLIEEERAATRELKEFFLEERRALLKKMTVIKERVPTSGDIPEDQQSLYYSAWYFQAIHVLWSIPRYRDPALMGEALKLPLPLVRETLGWLKEVGILDGRHIHLKKESPRMRQHHTHWRLKVLQSLDAPAEGDLHYSSVFSLAKKDAVHIREKLLQNLNDYLKVVTDSPEEEAVVFCFDFFGLTREN